MMTTLADDDTLKNEWFKIPIDKQLQVI